MDSSTVVCWTSLFVILGVLGLFFCLYSIFDKKRIQANKFNKKCRPWSPGLLANSVDPDQMPHYLASDLGLHCLPTTLLWVSR